MEVGEAVLALDFVDAELDFAEGVVFILLEVREGDFENAAFEGIVGVLETGCAVYEGFADTVGFCQRLCGMCRGGFAHSRMLNVDGALIEYQSFRVNGSWVLFLRPFLPFDKRLFLGVVSDGSNGQCRSPARAFRVDSLSDSHNCDLVYLVEDR